MTEHLSSKSAAGLRREISDDFKYDKKHLKHLKHILHNVNVAVGTLVSALNEFSKVKGPDISPDGLLGGLGYITPLKTIKEVLNGSIHNLSDVSDSIADELGNPHWKAEDDKDIKDLIKEKEEIEEEAEDAGADGEGGSPEKGQETEEEKPEEKPEEKEPGADEEPEPVEEPVKEEKKPESDAEAEIENVKKLSLASIEPNDVVTNKDFAAGKTATEIFSDSVRDSLVRFSSVGKKKI